MDRRALAVQQTRARHCIASGAKPCDGGATARLAAQPVQHFARRCLGDINAAAQHDCILAVQLDQVAVQLKGAPVGAGGRNAAFANDRPVIQFAPGGAVSDSQAFDGRGKAQHSELIQQHKDEPPRCAAMSDIDDLGRGLHDNSNNVTKTQSVSHRPGKGHSCLNCLFCDKI